MQNNLEMIINFHSFDNQEKNLINYLEMIYMSNIIIENNLDLLFLQLAKKNNIYYLDNELQLEIEIINKVSYYKFLSGKKKIISKINNKIDNNKIDFIILPLLIIENKSQDFIQNFIIFDKKKNIVFKYGKILKNDEQLNNILNNFVLINFFNLSYQIKFNIDQDKIVSLHRILDYFYNDEYLQVDDYSYFLKNCYEYIFNELWFQNLDRINYHRLIYNSTKVDIQLKTLKKLLKQNDFNLINLSVDGLTTLELSCKKGLLDFSKILIEYGANINTRSEFGLNSPLHLSIKFNKNINSQHSEIIKYLINKNVDVNTYDDTLTTPLFTAAAKNDIQTFNLLIDKGAIANTKTITHKNIIHYMCSAPDFFTIDKLNLEILNKLIDNGIKLEDLDIDNCNTLHLACKYLNNKLVNWIVEMNQKFELDLLEQKDSTGKTPLDIVKNTIIDYQNYLDNIKVLVDKDFAKLNITDDEKSSELKIINYFLKQRDEIINNIENILI